MPYLNQSSKYKTSTQKLCILLSKKPKTISNVGINILSLHVTFTFIKSPVWQGKSPVTGHEPDNKKCLVCKPDLMFVTHLAIAKQP